MVLILSIDLDPSTCDVIDWLVSMNKKFIRINLEDDISLIELSLNHFVIEVNGQKIHSDVITAFWYRRGDFFHHIPDNLSANEKIKNCLHSFLREEYRSIFMVLHRRLSFGKSLSSIFTASSNKINVLENAQKVGLKVPDTIVTTRKEVLLSFYQKHNKNIISKSISGILSLHTIDGIIGVYTEQIHNDVLVKLPDSFELSLFQEKIEKRLELRVFCLKGEFYAMAIFSQLDEQTSVDFRKYNKIKPNRTVPFLLEEELKCKLSKLMKALSLDTGSIDLILGTDGDIYFLEVNPVGQFGMTSIPCNYYLEERIANVL